MANNFNEAFYRSYNNNVYTTAQVKGNAFRGKTREVVQGGEMEFYETIGTVVASAVGTSTGYNEADTPLNEILHTKRVCSLTDYHAGVMINKLDEVKALASFQSPYIDAIVKGLNRKRDIVTISGLYGTAVTGKTAGSTAAFDFTNQSIAVDTGSTGATGMNVAKLRAIRAKFWANGYTNDDEICIAMSGVQLADLLASTEVTSTDYNSVKTLVNGEVNQFMGMTIIQSELLPYTLTAGGVSLSWSSTTDLPVDTNSTKTRGCVAWIKNGVIVGVKPDIMTRVSERADKSYNWQAYAAIGVGATRLEEKAVVHVPCLQP